MDKGDWQATVHGVTRVRYDLATTPPPPPKKKKSYDKSYWIRIF